MGHTAADHCVNGPCARAHETEVDSACRRSAPIRLPGLIETAMTGDPYAETFPELVYGLGVQAHGFRGDSRLGPTAYLAG
jgi:hypothetical protein